MEYFIKWPQLTKIFGYNILDLLSKSICWYFLLVLFDKVS